MRRTALVTLRNASDGVGEVGVAVVPRVGRPAPFLLGMPARGGGAWR
jgi:hypothetical protein